MLLSTSQSAASPSIFHDYGPSSLCKLYLGKSGSPSGTIPEILWRKASGSDATNRGTSFPHNKGQQLQSRYHSQLPLHTEMGSAVRPSSLERLSPYLGCTERSSQITRTEGPFVCCADYSRAVEASSGRVKISSSGTCFEDCLSHCQPDRRSVSSEEGELVPRQRRISHNSVLQQQNGCRLPFSIKVPLDAQTPTSRNAFAKIAHDAQVGVCVQSLREDDCSQFFVGQRLYAPLIKERCYNSAASQGRKQCNIPFHDTVFSQAQECVERLSSVDDTPLHTPELTSEIAEGNRLSSDCRGISNTPLNCPSWLRNVNTGFFPPKIPKEPISFELNPLDYPVHAPKVNVCDAKYIESYIEANGSIDRFHQLQDILFPRTAPPCLKVGIAPAKISDSELSSLVAVGIWEPANEHDKVSATAFLIPEINKKRRRLITWPILANNIPYEPQVTLPDAKVLLSLLHAGDYAVALDLKCAFYQHLIPRWARQWYVIRVKDKKYRQVRMCMGSRAAVEYLQIILQSLLSDAPISFHVHVDNILLVGPKEEVLRYSTTFRQRLLASQLTVGEVQEGESVTVHGLYFNFALPHKSIKIARPEKISSIIELTDQLEQITLRQFFKAAGRLQYFCRLLPRETCLRPLSFHLWQEISHYSSQFMSGQLCLNSALPLASQTKQLLRKVASEVFRYTYYFAHVPDIYHSSDLIIVTDASSTGIAGVILHMRSRRMLSFAHGTHILTKIFRDQRSPIPEEINHKELWVLLYAVSLIQADTSSPNMSLSWYADNRQALYAVANRRSPTESMNDLILQIEVMLTSRNICIKNESADKFFIQSCENPVDEMSRCISKKVNLFLLERIVQRECLSNGK